MWQSLDMNGWAKSINEMAAGNTKPQMAILSHLRDFSSRVLTPQDEDILPPEPSQHEEWEADEPVDGAEMAPFCLDEPQKDEVEEEPAIDLQAIRDEAFERGRESLKEMMAAERERLVETHRQTLAETRQTLINSMAGDLAAHCHSAFAVLQSSLEQELAQLLAALIGEKLESQAIAHFVQELAREAISASQPLIIEGKKPLLDAFIVQAQANPAIDLDHYQLKVNETSELRLIHQDRVLSTRLAPLLQQLREII